MVRKVKGKGDSGEDLGHLICVFVDEKYSRKVRLWFGELIKCTEKFQSLVLGI